jgi:lipid-binding SYLF domain-containing protein
MLHTLKTKFSALFGVALLASAGVALAAALSPNELIQNSQKTVSMFKQTDPSMEKLFTSSAGYAVIPEVKKGAFIVGGAGGEGVLYAKGQPIGKVTLTQMSVGAQAGGQTYSQIVFLKDDAALQKFKSGNVEMSAQASGVAVKSGGSAQAKWMNGMAVFTGGEAGLMAEASLGGQKFKFEPFSKAKPGT